MSVNFTSSGVLTRIESDDVRSYPESVHWRSYFSASTEPRPIADTRERQWIRPLPSEHYFM
jgi:hypothetical protein